MTFGKLIKDERKRRGLSQDALAELADNACTGSYISYLENQRVGKKGKTVQPDISIVEALARVLEIPPDMARTAAGYATSNSMLENIGIPINDLSALLGYYEKLNLEWRAVARKLFLGILNNLYELQLSETDAAFTAPGINKKALAETKVPPVLYAASESEIENEQTLRERKNR